jgi:rubrerythrin
MGNKRLDSALVAIGIAIQTEKDGRDFYLSAAEKTRDPQGKALFSSLAEDELDHLRLLETQEEALLKEHRWLPLAARGGEGRPGKLEGAPIFSRGAVAQDINAYTSDLSALRMAYLIERDAVGFYSKAASETDEPDGKAVYEYLVAMEKDHQRILEQEYKALAKEFRSSMGFEPF